MKPVVIEEEAEQELAESVSFYEQRRSGLGLEVEAAARGAVSTLQQSPERSPLRKDGTRRHIMRRFPFIIHYLDMPDYLWIVAFAHASRKPNYWRARLHHKQA